MAGAIDRVFKLLDRYIFHIDTQVRTVINITFIRWKSPLEIVTTTCIVQLSQNVGRCRPLWIIYMEIYNTACRNFLDGLVRVDLWQHGVNTLTLRIRHFHSCYRPNSMA